MTPENPPQNFDAAQLDEIANPLETDKKSQIDYNSPNIYASEEPNFNVNVSGFLKYQKKNDLEINVPENPKQNNVQQINSIRKRGYGRPLNASKFEDEIKNNQAVMQFIQKLEYQKSLEYQMLERHLKKSNEQKVQQLEERIEELKFSRDQFKKELERKSASPETNNIYARKPVFNESSEFTRKPDKHSLRKSHFTPTKQAAPPQEISNNSASSKKNFGTQDTYGSRDPMNDTSEYNNVYNYLQLQNEFSKMREELRENTERLQKEISDSRFSYRKPSYGDKYYHPYGADNKLLDHRFSFQKEIIRENPAIITAPLKFNESRMSLLNETRLIPIQKTEQSRESPIETKGRGHLEHLLQMATNLEIGLNAQNLRTSKEIQELKLEIFNLRDKKIDKAEYDIIKGRLSEMADQQLRIGKKIDPVRSFRLQKRLRGVKRKQRETEDERKAKHSYHPPK